ncbi:MAG: glycoside hydrolase [Fuerstiella sp.]|nr:glycoside hydrolase [Fuerstiella sp.]
MPFVIHRFVATALLLITGFTCSHSVAATPPTIISHILVHGADGKFAGWPANHGMWIWDNEILVGFSTGIHKNLGKKHNIDRDKPEHHVLARSLDGGETWTMEFPNDRGMLINEGGQRHGITDPLHSEPSPVTISEPINFAHPHFCMTMRFQNIHGGTSRLYYSYDRGHNWKGPFVVPSFGQSGIMARTDYIVNSQTDCHVFLTASKSNQKEGRVICGRTTDGGINWHLISYVGPEPNGFSIMPSTIRLNPTELLMTTRRREGKGEDRHRWIDTWGSSNNGESWKFLNHAVADLGEGNPPSLIQLRDGRLVLTYGDRQTPFEIRAQLSSDGGRTWQRSFVLNTVGGGRDMGYTRSVQRPDGKVVTLYYHYTSQSVYRRISNTIWDPGTREL